MKKNEAVNLLRVGSFSPGTILFKTNLVLDTFHESYNKVPFALSNIPVKMPSILLNRRIYCNIPENTENVVIDYNIWVP